MRKNKKNNVIVLNIDLNKESLDSKGKLKRENIHPSQYN